MKKAVIIGASSGIGKELARVFSRNNYEVGIAARRLDLLEGLRRELPNVAAVAYIDLCNNDDIEKRLETLIAGTGGADVIVISSGTGFLNDELEWEKEKATIDVNVLGFARVVNFAVRYFSGRGEGHLVGISSIGALRGNATAPAYNASKAFVSNYLEGIRCKMKKSGLHVTVTEILPGFVDTAMAKGEGQDGKGGLFWVASPVTAANQIYAAIVRKRERAYVTRRWRLIAWLLKIMPGSVYSRF